MAWFGAGLWQRQFDLIQSCGIEYGVANTRCVDQRVADRCGRRCGTITEMYTKHSRYPSRPFELRIRNILMCVFVVLVLRSISSGRECEGPRVLSSLLEEWCSTRYTNESTGAPLRRQIRRQALPSVDWPRPWILVVIFWSWGSREELIRQALQQHQQTLHFRPQVQYS